MPTMWQNEDLYQVENGNRQWQGNGTLLNEQADVAASFRYAATAGGIDSSFPINTLHPLNQGLISWYYPLPHTVGGAYLHDLEANLNPGSVDTRAVLTNGPTWSTGPYGFGALAFDGTNDYAVVANNPLRGLGAFTATCWCYLNAAVTTPAPMGDWSGAGVKILLRYSGGTLQVFSHNGTAQFGGGTGAPFPVGRWVQVGMTYDGATLVGYANGIPGSTTFAMTGTVNPGVATSYYIGYANSGSGTFFPGRVTDVRLMNRALSAGEMQQLYQQSTSGYPNLLRRTTRRIFLPAAAPATVAMGYLRRTSTYPPPGTPFAPGSLRQNLLGYWPMNEGSGGTITNLVSGVTSPYADTWSGGQAFYTAATGTNLAGVATRLRSFPLSISAWVRPKIGGATGTIVGIFDTGSTARIALSCFSTNAFTLVAGDPANNFINTTVGNVPVPGQWTHVAVVIPSATSCLVFVNGQLTFTASGPIDAIAAANSVTVGYSNTSGSPGSKMIGAVSSVAIWNRAISADEARQLAGSQFGLQKAPPVLALPTAPTPPSFVRVPDLKSGARVDATSPVNMLHPLNRGLGCWLLNLPGFMDAQLRDLTNQVPLTRSGSNFNSWTVDANGFPAPTGVAASWFSGGGETSLDVGTGDFSLSVWVKYVGTTTGIVVNKAIATSTGYDMLVNSASGLPTFRLNFSTGINGTTALNDNKWHHLLGTRVGTTATLYVDGVSVGTTPHSASLSVPTTPLTVGGRAGVSFFPTGHSYTDIRIYPTRGLSAEEAFQLYDQGRRGNPDLLRRVSKPIFFVQTTGSLQSIIVSAVGVTDSYGNALVDAPASLSINAVTTSEQEGNPVAAPGDVALSPLAVPYGEQEGNPSTAIGAVSLSPLAVPSSEQEGNPTTAPGAAALTPLAVPSSEQEGNPATAPGAVNASPKSVTTAEVFGNPTTAPGAASTSPKSITTSEVFGNPTASLGAVFLSPLAVPSGETAPTPTVAVGASALAFLGISSSEAPGNPAASPGSVTVTAVGVPEASAFGVPSVQVGASFVTPLAVGSSETAPSPALAPGAVTITSVSVTTAAVVPGGSLASVSAVTLVGVRSAEQEGNPTTAPGAAPVTPLAVPGGEAQGAVTLLPGAVNVAAVAVTSAERAGVISIAVGGSLVSPSAVASQESAGPALVVGAVAVSPRAIATAEVVSPAPLSRAVTVYSVASAERCGVITTSVSGVTLAIYGIRSEAAVGSIVIPSATSLAYGAAFHLTIFVDPTGPLF